MLNRTALTVFLYASFLYFLKRIVFVKRHVWFFRIYTSEQVKTIEEVLEKMKTDEYRLETFADYDFMFHKSIADASGNKVFSLMMETIRPMLYSHIIYTLNPNFNPELSNHFHETILEAIKAKDPNAASAAMAAHLAGTKSIIDELESANVTL